MSAITDGLDDHEDWVTHPRSRPRRPRGASFADLHGAYHVVNRRLARDLRAHGISPSEAVVLLALRRYPMATVSFVRQATGLRPSTLDTLLDRLTEREILERASPRDVPREVVVVVSARGRLLTEYAVQVFRELDEELAAFIGTEALASLGLVFEAARALGVPGTAADL
jgi:DNA-binding MarR family transcriptional regulator